MDPVGNLPDVDRIMQLYGAGLLGFSESRSLLEKHYPVFVDIRDHDLDKEMTGEEE